MVCSCCDFASAAGRQFTAKKAAKELQAYRSGRLGPTTRLLREGIVRTGLGAGSLLDVGAGIGALTFELLDRGVARAVAVDASTAYLDGAREEAARRSRGHDVTFVHGDFVTLSAALAPADLVTLDRVVCCYGGYRALLVEAARLAARGLAFSYPRDRWFVRWSVGAENAARRVRGNPFRTFVHPAADMERLLAEAGFGRVARSQTSAWSADVYARRPAATSRELEGTSAAADGAPVPRA